ncbi:MAG: VanW family protein [Aureispira sp.]
MIKRIIPQSIKLFLRIWFYKISKVLSKSKYKLARKNSPPIDYPQKTTLPQALKPNHAKLVNLKLASQAIASVHIYPHEVFSFWDAVGAPSKRNGYQASRSIMNNQVINSIGGGLCQLSGLIYHLALIADLEIVERYNHSMDIYTEETRYYPLGADATVVYGYKDLKIRNNYSQPINFRFVIEEETITLELHSFEKIQKLEVQFEPVQQTALEIEIATIINHTIKDKSTYKKPV